jgi:hypothetical protein
MKNESTALIVKLQSTTLIHETCRKKSHLSNCRSADFQPFGTFLGYLTMISTSR